MKKNKMKIFQKQKNKKMMNILENSKEFLMIKKYIVPMIVMILIITE